MMDILMSKTCWAHKKWNKIASDIKLVFHSSTIWCSVVSDTRRILCHIHVHTTQEPQSPCVHSISHCFVWISLPVAWWPHYTTHRQIQPPWIVVWTCCWCNPIRHNWRGRLIDWLAFWSEPSGPAMFAQPYNAYWKLRHRIAEKACECQDSYGLSDLFSVGRL